MTQKITPFLWFNNNAEEAINFYLSIFKDGSLKSVKRYPDGPLEGPMKGMEGKVMTAVFELFGQLFMAIDGGPIFKPSAAISFYVECQTQEEVDRYWDALSEGGDPKFQECGWLQDKYGFTWQIIPSALPRLINDPDSKKADRVLQAMLKMKKISIKGLEDAASGH